jgi:hypothetical protein
MFAVTVTVAGAVPEDCDVLIDNDGGAATLTVFGVP